MRTLILLTALVLSACTTGPGEQAGDAAVAECVEPGDCGALRVCVDSVCYDQCKVPRPGPFECEAGTTCTDDVLPNGAEFSYCAPDVAE